MTGMERYAIEITRRLDELVDPDSELIYLVVPSKTTHNLQFKNIRVVEKGRLIGGNFAGYLWEQLSFAVFLRSQNAQGYLPLNFVPVLQPDVVVTIHDVNALTHPEFFPTTRKRMYRLLASTLLRVARSRTQRIMTVSNAAREEMIQRCGFELSSVKVAYPGLEHVPTAAPQVSLDVPDHFYFALSSATYNKNFEWVLATAAQNPAAQFIIAGAGDFTAILDTHHRGRALPNVRHLGYITDEERDWLYSRCQAFLFPSRYEGFGLPPLEAACFGAPLVVADIAPMREIFGDGFRYIDPESPVTDLKSFVNHPDPARLRARYTWDKSAATVLEQLRRRYVNSYETKKPGGQQIK